jgi:hypothetical protein
MSEEPADYGASIRAAVGDQPTVIKLATFTLVDGQWDIQLWVNSAKPVNAKVYRLKVRVPDELTGEVAATVAVSPGKTG